MIRRLEILKEVLSAPTWRKDAQKTVRLYLHVHNDSVRHNMLQFRAWENCVLCREEVHHHKGGQKLQWVAQRGCGISILSKSIKNLAGQDLEQPSLIFFMKDKQDSLQSKFQSKLLYDSMVFCSTIYRIAIFPIKQSNFCLQCWLKTCLIQFWWIFKMPLTSFRNWNHDLPKLLPKFMGRRI